MFHPRQVPARLSVRQALRGKQILLIGVTGFIAKVWLEHILSEVPEIGKIYLLIRRQRTTPARSRFEKIDRGVAGFRSAGKALRRWTLNAS